MASSLDIFILPLTRRSGQDRPDIPGLYIATPPKRPARFRDRDRLALHLYLEGNAPLSEDQVNQLLANLAKTYYSTQGTVTTAQRAVGEALNQFLFDRNLRNTSTGQQAVGQLTQIVFREGRLYLAQSGLTHAFIISASGVEYVHDIYLAGNGLGINRTASVRFTQIELNPNDGIVLSNQLPVGWTQNFFQTLIGQGPESLRRKLLAQAGSELQAILFQAQVGKGEFRQLRPVQPQRPVQTNIPPAVAESAHTSSIPSDLEATPSDTTVSVPPMATSNLDAQTSVKLAKAGKAVAMGAGANRIYQRTKDSSSRGMRRALASVAIFIQRLLPDRSIFTIPPSTMIFIAVAVPVIIVTVAAVVYYQRGNAAQFDTYFAQAQEAVASAETKTEPQEQRIAWEAALIQIEKAENFKKTTESQSLHQQAQSILDNLDTIGRLDYQPAIAGGLEEDTNITRMATVDEDLYLLNSLSGAVQRASLTSEGYRIDSLFQCGPGPYPGQIIGPIIDIAAVPRNTEKKAAIVGLDNNRNLIYCNPGMEPETNTLTPPDVGWEDPIALAVDSGDLYILDPKANAVWIYRGMDTSSPPRLFFDEQIPPMGSVIDFTVNQNDLYLLHNDSHISFCEFSLMISSPTRCEDPANFTDPRLGRQSGSKIEGAVFTEIQFSPPPEPSIFTLDPVAKAIYRFSLKLTYNQQYRPLESLSKGNATSFTINKNNRTVFLAVGNQIFYAALP